MGLANKRLIVPITAKDKARVEKKAAAAGKLSTAEYIRRAALNYEPADAAAEAELASLLAGFKDLHKRTLAQLDKTDAVLEIGLARFRHQ
ncbi:MAG TPA: ribbon-helix-helix protein, CopG family [Methylocella sp.]|nr:ribbon-helix-helix protein, CopG family [Methylocella sp.]